MAYVAYGFNGTIVSLGGVALGQCRVDVDYGGGEVDVTASLDTAHKKEATLPDPTITVEHFGCPNAAFAAAGALIITWPDTTNDSLGAAVVVGTETRGRINEPIVSTITLKARRAT